MKTAISIPDAVFRDAEHTAKRLGVSRSELYVRALQQFLAAQQADQVTEALNAVYAPQDAPTADPELLRASRRSLADVEW